MKYLVRAAFGVLFAFGVTALLVAVIGLGRLIYLTAGDIGLFVYIIAGIGAGAGLLIGSDE